MSQTPPPSHAIPSHSVASLSLHGALTFAAHQEVRKALLGLPPHFSQLDLDLRQVTELDGAGLGLLLLIHDLCREKGARLNLHGAQAEVAQTLDLSGFTQMLEKE